MNKIKNVSSFFNNKGHTFEETIESLIFSCLEEENDY